MACSWQFADFAFYRNQPHRVNRKIKPRSDGSVPLPGYIRDAIAKADQRFTVHHIEENLKHAGHELPRTTVYWALWDMTKKNELRKIESQPGRKGVIYEKTG